MSERESNSPLMRRILPRVGKAIVKGLLYFFLFYALPMLLISQVSRLAPQLFAEYEQILALFAALIIFFAVASELTSGTIYQHAINVGKALILILFIVVALNGGIVKLNLDVVQGQRIGIVADLRIYLMMIITIDLLGLSRSVMQMVNFLSEKSEKQIPQPLPHENP